jgi:hypothetical protein
MSSKAKNPVLATMKVSEYAFESSNKPEGVTVIRGQKNKTAEIPPIKVAAPKTIAISCRAGVHIRFAGGVGFVLAGSNLGGLRLRPLDTGMSSASADHCAKNIQVHSVLIPELKFRDVQWHVFGADFVERTDDPALEDRPEA